MEKVEKLATIYAGHIDEMADLITAEMGSPRSFSRMGQAAGAAHMMQLALATGREFRWEERRPGVLGEVHLRKAPAGVVGAIVPWNVPQFLIMPKLIPALIAGCTVVVKPAPETPLDALWLAEMLEEVDLPEGVVSIVPGAATSGMPGAPSRCGQDRVHRVQRHRASYRRDLRRAAQAGEPGTGWQVGGDHSRRRRHRQDRRRAEDGQPDEQRAGVCGADAHPGQRTPSRRGRRRARRHDGGPARRRSR
ncbi:aldehyde dehydrogenase family protein [Mycobacterium xenopi 3993]|nr:aldehyde dehydrogenase family protein [Mycobacterium xenopi 3993]